jgi:hypothetical protein
VVKKELENRALDYALDLRPLAALDEKLRIDLLSILSGGPLDLDGIVKALRSMGWRITGTQQ